MKKIIIRLKKIEGQIAALRRILVEELDDCEKVSTQFMAAKSALDSAFFEVLNTHLKHCLQSNDDKKMEKVLKLLAKK